MQFLYPPRFFRRSDMRYQIMYKETYASIYDVDADSLSEAIAYLDEEIREGKIEGPCTCVCSEYKEV